MEPTSALARQLGLLTRDHRRAVRLSTGLDSLRQDVTAAVPSCTAVSITLVRLGGALTITALGPGGARPVRASLAVPLAGPVGGDVLVLRADQPGAFLLLADDLAGVLAPGQPPLAVDQDLDGPPVLTDELLAVFLSDTRAVDQALGVLLDQGLPPETALRELGRRAAAAGVGLAEASRAVLASAVPPRRPPGLDSTG